MTSSIPTSAATARAVASLSPVSRTGRRPSAAQRARPPRADVGLTVSATTRTARARAVPADGDRGAAAASAARAARRRAPAGACTAPVAAQQRRAGRRRRRGPRRRPRRRGPRGWRRTRRPGARRPPRAARAIARAIGCSEASSSAPARRSASARSTPGGGHDLDEAHPARRHGAGLVEHDRVDAAGGLEDLRPLDEQAELRAAAGADHQRGRRGEAERARAGDDQHGDGGGERERRALAGAEPEPERGDREARSRPARTRPRRGRRAAGPAPCRSARPSTSRAICASAVSAPTFVARTTRRPPALTVAPATSSPGRHLDRHRLAREQ